jgi:hypothetical protein
VTAKKGRRCSHELWGGRGEVGGPVGRERGVCPTDAVRSKVNERSVVRIAFLVSSIIRNIHIEVSVGPGSK